MTHMRKQKQASMAATVQTKGRIAQREVAKASVKILRHYSGAVE